MTATRGGLVGGLRLGGRVLRRGEEEIAGSGAELEPEVAEDIEMVAAGNVLGAKGEAQGEIKTHT